MIGYLTVGTNDLKKSATFYDALFNLMGIERSMEEDKFIVWGKPDIAQFSITHPFDKQAATVGNGVMVAFSAPSQDLVNKIHAKALELGATDEGAVGYREGMSGFYVGYFRDLDGNKLSVYHLNKDD